MAESRKGNPVRIGDGHAAVIGDETCQIHYSVLNTEWEGARRLEVPEDFRPSRMIRKPENLPECASH